VRGREGEGQHAGQLLCAGGEGRFNQHMPEVKQSILLIIAKKREGTIEQVGGRKGRQQYQSAGGGETGWGWGYRCLMLGVSLKNSTDMALKRDKKKKKKTNYDRDMSLEDGGGRGKEERGEVLCSAFCLSVTGKKRRQSRGGGEVK